MRVKKYSNDDAVPCILESKGDEKTFMGDWTQFFLKVALVMINSIYLQTTP